MWTDSCVVESPKVTIYTQTYNAKEYLKQCMDSVLLQTYPFFEWILVDNGCSDGSSEIMEEYARNDNRIRLIKFQKNQREIIARISQKYATGQYYTVLDSDDWWEKDYLQVLVNLAISTKADMVCTGVVMHNAETNQCAVRKSKSCY